MSTLTPRQKQILDFIKSYINKKGVSPTFEEIGKHTKKAFATVHEHVEALIQKGFLTKTNNSSRGIELKTDSTVVKIPLLGTIAAGEPIEAVEVREVIAIPLDKLPHSGNIFALKIRGNSMIEENIHDGDYVIIKQQATADVGQKVVALIDNETATLKKYYPEKTQVRLQPANQKLKPMFHKKSQVAIQGIVVDIIKGTEPEAVKYHLPWMKKSTK